MPLQWNQTEQFPLSRKNPAWLSPGGVRKRNPGNNLLSRFTHYHWPWMLNGRVRNGNGCDHPGMLTGKLLVAVLMDRHRSKKGLAPFSGSGPKGASPKMGPDPFLKPYNKL